MFLTWLVYKTCLYSIARQDDSLSCPLLTHSINSKFLSKAQLHTITICRINSIHKPKTLKPKVAASSEIKELSKSFVMVNVCDDEEPKDKKFAPDGAYIPRILFLNHKGDVMTEYFNDYGISDYKYYYFDTESIARSMRKVIQGSAQKLQTKRVKHEIFIDDNDDTQKFGNENNGASDNVGNNAFEDKNSRYDL